MHTEPVENRVNAQLAKPEVKRTNLSMATANIRYVGLKWVTIICGAITLFGSLDVVLDLADWARLLVEHWSYWMHTIWEWTFAWIGIDLLPFWSPILSFAVFAASTLAARRFLDDPSRDFDELPDFRRRNALIAGACMSATYLAFSALMSFVFRDIDPDTLDNLSYAILVLPGIVFVGLFASQHRVQAIISVLLFAPLAYILLFLPLDAAVVISVGNFGAVILPEGPSEIALFAAALLVLLAGVVPAALTVVPARRLNQRFLFMLVGLAILVALNELSKLNLSISASG